MLCNRNCGNCNLWCSPVHVRKRFDKTFFPKIAPFSCTQVQNYILQALVERGWERWCGFWPRVRARARRAPVFLGSLPRQTGRCAPPRPSQLRCFLFDPQKYLQSIELGPPTSRAFFFPQMLWNMRSPSPAPPIAASLILPSIFLGSNYVFYILTVCCITDMHINDIHISVILRGFSRGPSLFWSIWGQNYVNIMSPAPSHRSLADPDGIINDTHILITMQKEMKLKINIK